ncbi:hypothetical protein RJ639_028008 [Escallonia herrerae]|uniref:GAG-pre-integrase domain-containing protein n=1 Tax=Escallonia herrerae TaxID=1293975 RepID=A0AA88XC51_9ASTE|nr:hypothetical protein RJ639_028008 [Escallonia herrerae]
MKSYHRNPHVPMSVFDRGQIGWGSSVVSELRFSGRLKAPCNGAKYFDEEGHCRKDCPEHKEKKKDNSKTADAGVVEDNSDGADVRSVTIRSSDGGWILDTSCSYHMCPNRDWFVTYRSFDGGKVLMGNNVACKMVGIGSIQIRMHDGIVKTLTDVRHVPELRKNLISLGTLDSNGCSYRATGGVMRIMKGALVVMKGLKQNSLYLLQGSTVTGAAATASSSDIDSDTTKLWHMHLGHMSERGMDVLSKQGLLGSKKIGKLDFCEHCVSGKQCRKELIDAGKDHGVREKVELKIRTPDSLPIIPTDEDDGSHSTEENEESQEQQYNIAKNRPRREIQPPQNYGYTDMVAYALSVAESIEVEKPVTYKDAIKSTESVDMMAKHIPEIKFKDGLDLISISTTLRCAIELKDSFKHQDWQWQQMPLEISRWYPGNQVGNSRQSSPPLSFHCKGGDLLGLWHQYT